MDEQAARKVSMAKAYLLLNHPFWGYVATNIRYHEEEKVMTMGTNGRDIYYAPAFVDSCTPRQLATIIAHEICHIIFDHSGRLGMRDFESWCVASDIAVNNMLHEAKNFEFPPGGHLGNQNYSQYPVEKIYELINTKKNIVDQNVVDQNGRQSQYSNGSSQQSNSGQGKSGKDKEQKNNKGQNTGDSEDSGNNNNPKNNKNQNRTNSHPDYNKISDNHDEWGEILSQQEKDMLKKEIREILAGAVVQVKNKGDVPGQISELIGETLEPKLDWKELLRDCITGSTKNDFRLVPGNKKHIWRGMILPSLYGQSIEMAFAIDSSGSMSDTEIKEAFSEVLNICETYDDYTIHLFICDAAVHQYEVITIDNPELPKKVLGRGGTSFVPVFQEIEKLQLEINVLVYFTDMYGNFPEAPTNYDTIWLSTGEDKAPFGTVILYDREK